MTKLDEKSLNKVVGGGVSDLINKQLICFKKDVDEIMATTNKDNASEKYNQINGLAAIQKTFAMLTYAVSHEHPDGFASFVKEVDAIVAKCKATLNIA